MAVQALEQWSQVIHALGQVPQIQILAHFLEEMGIEMALKSVMTATTQAEMVDLALELLSQAILDQEAVLRLAILEQIYEVMGN